MQMVTVDPSAEQLFNFHKFLLFKFILSHT